MAHQNLESTQKLAGRKAGLVLGAARKLFLMHGYSDTSMDAVAAESGVSKATLYAYFTDKKDLFAAVVEEFSVRYSTTTETAVAPGEDLKAGLQRLAKAVLSLLLAPDAVAAHRMVIAEAVRSPKLGRLYHESGPARLAGRVELFLKAAMHNGQLRTANPAQAAEHFIALIKGNLRLRALVCVDEPIAPKERKAVIASGVDAFIRAYWPEPRIVR